MSYVMRMPKTYRMWQRTYVHMLSTTHLWNMSNKPVIRHEPFDLWGGARQNLKINNRALIFREKNNHALTFCKKNNQTLALLCIYVYEITKKIIAPAKTAEKITASRKNSKKIIGTPMKTPGPPPKDQMVDA